MVTSETDCSATHIQQASFQCATITRPAALLQSGTSAFSSPPRFHVSVWREETLLGSDTRQMFHSNVAFAYCGGSNEFLRGGRGPSSLCQGWARGTHTSTAAKLNLMFNLLQERCINQSFWFAWTVASENKPGQKMMSWWKQCNLRFPNKNKQWGGGHLIQTAALMSSILLKTWPPPAMRLSFKQRRRHWKALILFSRRRKRIFDQVEADNMDTLNWNVAGTEYLYI